MSCSIKLDPSDVAEAKLWRDDAKATQSQYEQAVRDLLEARQRISDALAYIENGVASSYARRDLRRILAGPLPPKAKAAAASTDRDEWGKQK